MGISLVWHLEYREKSSLNHIALLSLNWICTVFDEMPIHTYHGIDPIMFTDSFRCTILKPFIIVYMVMTVYIESWSYYFPDSIFCVKAIGLVFCRSCTYNKWWWWFSRWNYQALGSRTKRQWRYSTKQTSWLCNYYKMDLSFRDLCVPS